MVQIMKTKRFPTFEKTTLYLTNIFQENDGKLFTNIFEEV